MKIKSLNNYHIILLASISSILFYLRFTKSLNAVPDIGKYDSNSYFKFNLFGGLRMPIITLIYDVIENPVKITIFQTTISAISLFILSLSLFLLKFKKDLILVTGLLIVVLGNSSQIIYLDSSMDSESLNLTAINFLLSSIIILFNTSSSRFAKVYFFICLIFFVGIKTMNNVISIFILTYLVLFKNYLLISKKRKIFSYTVIIVIMSLNLTYFTNTKITPELNTSAIINSRLWEVPKWREFILKNHFPVEARSIFVRFESRNLGEPPDAAVGDLKQFKNWYTEKGGNNFLLKFMISHPSYTFFGPIAFPLLTQRLTLDETIWRGAAVGRLDYETFTSANYQFLNLDFIFWPLDRSNAYFYLAIMIFVIGIGQIVRFLYKDYILELDLIVFLVFLFFSISYFAWWFGSTPSDLGRQQFAFAYGIRIVYILNLLIISELILRKSVRRIN